MAWAIALAIPIVLMSVWSWLTRALELFPGMADKEPFSAIESAFRRWFLGWTVVACFIGLSLGEYNFWLHLQPYYTITALDSYPAVDPNAIAGSQYLDAGRVWFKKGSRLDVSKAWSYTHGKQYCVVPVTLDVERDDTPHYDFWAVGTNCCSDESGRRIGGKARWRCGSPNQVSNAGLRVMHEDTGEIYFRKAAEQAKASLGFHHQPPFGALEPGHELFFYWLDDPTAEVNSWHKAGLNFFGDAMLIMFALQFFGVTTGALYADRWRSNRQGELRRQWEKSINNNPRAHAIEC